MTAEPAVSYDLKRRRTMTDNVGDAQVTISISPGTRAWMKAEIERRENGGEPEDDGDVVAVHLDFDAEEEI